SEYDQFNAPKFGRLHQKSINGITIGAWVPKASRVGEYLQIDLLQAMRINGVATQGRGTIMNWVKTYEIKYSLDGTS
ncbi:predicted protein, partial [Nematostella vectensis]